MLEVNEQTAQTEAPEKGRIEREFTVKERSQWRMALRRFMRHRVAVASLVVFILLVLFAFVGPMLWQYTYLKYTNDLSQPPTLKHPFGTDSTGFDQFAVVSHGRHPHSCAGFALLVKATIPSTCSFCRADWLPR